MRDIGRRLSARSRGSGCAHGRGIWVSRVVSCPGRRSDRSFIARSRNPSGRTGLVCSVQLPVSALPRPRRRDSHVAQLCQQVSAHPIRRCPRRSECSRSRLFAERAPTDRQSAAIRGSARMFSPLVFIETPAAGFDPRIFVRPGAAGENIIEWVSAREDRGAVGVPKHRQDRVQG